MNKTKVMISRERQKLQGAIKKVLQFPTLTNKLVKISCRMRIVKRYLVIMFWKNDDSVYVWRHSKYFY